MIAITIGFTVMPGFVPKSLGSGHGNGAAFLGGMVAGHVVGGMPYAAAERRTAAAEYTRPTVNRALSNRLRRLPLRPLLRLLKPTAQQRLDQLNKLAAGGYITPAGVQGQKEGNFG